MNTLTTKSAAAALLRPIAKVRPLLSKTDIREYRISASDLARVEVEARRWARKAHGRIGKAEIRELVLRERGGNSHRDWLAWRTPGWLGRDWHDHAGFPAQRRMRDDMLLRAKRGDAFFAHGPKYGYWPGETPCRNCVAPRELGSPSWHAGLCPSCFASA